MKTQRLIEQLAEGLQPVHKASRAGPTAAVWFAACALLVLAPVVAKLGVRPDLAASAATLGFMASGLAAAALAVAAATAGLTWGVPGLRVSRPLRVALVVLMGALVLSFFAYWPASQDHLQDGLAVAGVGCSAVVLAIAAVPGVALFFWLRRLAPMAPVRIGAVVGLAAGALGCLGVGMHCASDNTVHLLLYHCLPMAVVATVMGAAGGRWLRW